MYICDGIGYAILPKRIEYIPSLVEFHHGGTKPITNSYFNVSRIYAGEEVVCRIPIPGYPQRLQILAPTCRGEKEEV